MILAIDVGGTNVKFGIVDSNFAILKKVSMPTNIKNDADTLMERIAEKAKEISKEFPIEAIGIGMPSGSVNAKEGVVVHAENLGLFNVPVKKIMEEKLNIPTFIENDANCAALGELYAGAGSQFSNFLFITLGTGIGGGIVINKKIYSGASGGAGEFGDMIIEENGLPCSCGQKGCFEQYASVNALVRQTKNAIKKYPESILAQIATKSVSGETAFIAKELDCPVAEQVVDRYIEYIALGITNLANIFQPEAIILGGAITNEGDKLLVPLKKKVKYNVDIRISKLKNDAGIIGAASITKGDQL